VTLFLATFLAAVPWTQAQRADPLGPLKEMNLALEALAERVNPSVVQVFTTAYAPVSDAPTAAALITQRTATGSGVILDGSGYIVTNAHVVRGARRVQVLVPAALGRGRSGSILPAMGNLEGAQIVGVDFETDLAVLKIEAQGLPALPIGDSDDLKQGQLVFAFGSPLGLENSVSMGVVSALARQLKPEDPMIYIQTDATINPGNSGGPLVDGEGRVIGINTLILTQSGGSEGLGFAAPSNIVKNVFDQLRKTGRVRRGDIGVSAHTITPALAAALGLTRTTGVVVADVKPGSPSEFAGLRPLDVILSVDGKPMENGRQFQVNLYRRAISETVRLEVLRGAETLRLDVKVAERADDPHRFEGMVTPERNLVTALGILALDLKPGLSNLFQGLRKENGVVVAASAGDVMSLKGEGLMAGDVIYAVNRKPVSTVSELREALSGLPSGEFVALHVERAGRLIFVTLVLP